MSVVQDLIDRIINDDCRKGLKKIPDESIDACLSDPPYGIGLEYDNYNDNISDDDYWQMMNEVFTDVYRVLKPSTHCVFTISQNKMWQFRPLMEKIGFDFRHVGVWYNDTRKAGAWPGILGYAWEPVMFFSKGKYKKLNNGNGVGSTDVWVEKSPAGTEVAHKAARPLGMWNDIIKLISNKDEIVLDMFMGSGSTALVAMQNNRHYIGFEISEKYTKLAESRLSTLKSPWRFA